jgi:branched-chain amino acid transport system substrate-binding protein
MNDDKSKNIRQEISRSRRTVLKAGASALGTGLLAGLAPAVVRAQDKPITIGYTQSRTGVFSTGSQQAQEPNYQLWAEQVNAAGGLNVQGKRRKIELQGYDDRSDLETMRRTYEKLMTSDKVDLILPPWGTDLTFAIAPLANRNGYPIVCPTATSQKLVDLKLPNVFICIQQGRALMNSLTDMLVSQKVKTITVSYVDDSYGLENITALEAALKTRGIQVLEKKSYNLGIKDLGPMLRSMKAQSPDAYIALTYPPDLFLITSQAKEIAFSPRILCMGVGAAYPLYKQRMGAAVEGIMGPASWSPKSNPQAKAYFDAYVAHYKKQPDAWASGQVWASLQILQQAVEQTGLDRKAIRDYIATKEFSTVVGKMRFSGSEEVGTPGIYGQWQGDNFELIWPLDRKTADAVVPKPAWQ